jgi:hypothetical protein
MRIMSEVVKQYEPNDEPLSWLAFRYFSDEMSDIEVAEFEARLDPESDTFELATCEAVARAVQLNDAVAVACEPAIGSVLPSPVGHAHRRGLLTRRVSLLASAITVLAVGWALTTPPESVEVVEHPAPLPVEISSGVSGELIQLWANSGDELISVVDDAQMVPAVDVPDYRSDDVPDWLFAAVQSYDASSTDSEVMEN